MTQKMQDPRADRDDPRKNDICEYPEYSRCYPTEFTPDASYHASLPDLQNGPASLICGARREIQHVGISNFRRPMKFRTQANDLLQLEVSVTGTVSLDADRKGINMSRIMRSFYAAADGVVSRKMLEDVIAAYKRDLDSHDAQIQLKFAYPVLKSSLRSGLAGYQYYDVALEHLSQGDRTQHIWHLDYVYSSTCPCSLELSEHARMTRNQLATPHSQRSRARLSFEVLDSTLFIEDVIDLCRAAVPTETQTMVKREDEQAFAELNAANPVFVEDAVRLFAGQLEAEPRIGDFRVIANHQESLHSHDAVSVLLSGSTFSQGGNGLSEIHNLPISN